MSWSVVKLGDLIEPFSVKAKDYKDIDVSKLDFFGVSNTEGITISKYAAEDKANDYKIIEEGCFAYNPYRINVGSIALVKDDIIGLISPAYVVFKVKENTIIPELLLKFLKSSEGLRQIKLHARGTVRQALRFSDLCQIKISLPDYDEQKAFFKNLSNTEIESSVLSTQLTHQIDLVKQLRQAFLREAMQGKLLKSSPPFKEGWPKAGVVEDKLNQWPKAGEVKENPNQSPQRKVVDKTINNLPYLKTFRKKLRNNLTPAEAKLWTFLKGKQLEGRKFRRQFSVANYILDFYCPSEHLAIELDGQGHFEASQAEYDRERDLFLKHCGIKVLRFENKWVWNNPEELLEVVKNNFGWGDKNPSVLRTAPLEGEQLEDARNLLAKIKAKKEQLIKEKKIKKPKPLQPITKEEIPFEIPKNWVWCRLGEILEHTFYGPRFSNDDYVKDGIPTIRTTDMSEYGVIEIKDAPMVQIDSPSKIDLYKVQYNDLLVTRTGSIGTMVLFKSTYLAIPSAYLIRCRFIFNEMADYMFRLLKSNYALNYFGLNTKTGTRPNINAVSISNLIIPLPPLSEQKRIVAKLDELMSYCDSLEESIKNSQQQNEMLLGQVLREALEPKEKEVVV